MIITNGPLRVQQRNDDALYHAHLPSPGRVPAHALAHRLDHTRLGLLIACALVLRNDGVILRPSRNENRGLMMADLAQRIRIAQNGVVLVPVEQDGTVSRRRVISIALPYPQPVISIVHRTLTSQSRG